MDKLTLDILKAAGAEPCEWCGELTYQKVRDNGDIIPCHKECYAEVERERNSKHHEPYMIDLIDDDELGDYIEERGQE